MPNSTARLIAIIAATFVTSAAFAAQRTYDKQLNAPPGGQLTFRADVGSVTVVGSDAPAVVVHADLEGSDSFLSDFNISAEQTPSGVTILARKSHDGWSDTGPTRVRFTIEVPRNYPVALNTAGGSLDVRNLNAPVHAGTSGGSARVQSVAGTINVHTSGGSIDVADSTGDLDLNTSGGGIDIRNDDGKVQGHTSGGGIRAQLRTNRGISLSTSGGSITVLLPQDTHASVDAETSGGRVSSDFPLSTTDTDKRNHVQGAIGGGGAPISLHTSGGSIRLERG